MNKVTKATKNVERQELTKEDKLLRTILKAFEEYEKELRKERSKFTRKIKEQEAKESKK